MRSLFRTSIFAIFLAGALFLGASSDAHANQNPIIKAGVSINGAGYTNHITVTQGQVVTMTMSGYLSTDPDGWTTPGTGVSNGGSCSFSANWELAANWEQGNPNAPFHHTTINNPASPAACTYGPFQTTFSVAPGHYSYGLIGITDAGGLEGYPNTGMALEVDVVDPNPNVTPIALVKISFDGGPTNQVVFDEVTRGVPTHLFLDASSFTDGNGWTNPTKGVSSGTGKCQINTDMNKGTPTFEQTINNPATPSACSYDLGTRTFNDAPGDYTYNLARIVDAGGLVSSEGQFTIRVLPPNISNNDPIAVSQISADNGAFASEITVARGASVRVRLGADLSSDPNGWSTLVTGVSTGGKCEWNSDLNQGSTTYEQVIENPAKQSSCSIDLGNLVFNDEPGHYLYPVLRVTDAALALSNIASVAVNIVIAPTSTPCSNIFYDGDFQCPTPTPKKSPTPSCNEFGYNGGCPTGSVSPTVTPSPSDGPTFSPTPTTFGDPFIPPYLCPPDSECAAIIDGIIESTVDVITNGIAALFGVDPEKILEAIREKGNAIASVLVAAALALSGPLLLANVLPEASQGLLRFFGSLFGAHKRKDRWGIVIDSDMGKPIANAVVQVFDAAFNQLKETRITGADGQFGFLLPVGKYYILVSDTGFTFPARKRPPITLRDGERIYLGEEFVISEQNHGNIPHIVVPMDRDEKVPALQAFLRKYWSMLVVFIDRVGLASLFVGAIVNTYLFLAVPGKLNAIFEVLYLILFLIKLYTIVFHQKGVGSVIDRKTRKELDLAIVRLYNSKTNRIIQTRVTNVNGRFFLLVPRGEYTVSVSKKGYKALLINKLHITGKSSKAIALNFALESE